MAIDFSVHEKTLEELTEKIEREATNLTKLRARFAKANKKLEDLKRRKLEEAEIVEEEKKFEREKKDLIATVEEEGEIQDFMDFHKDTKDKVKGLVKDDDWKKIKKITDDKDKKILELQNDLERLEKEHAKDSEDLEKAKEAIKNKKEDLDKAFDEIKKLPLDIKGLKQKLLRHKKLTEIAGNKEEPLKMAFYLDEMDKTVKEIESLLKGKDQIIKRLDRKVLEDAQKRHDEAKKKRDESFEKVKDVRGGLEKERKAREGDILKEIEEMFPK